MKDLNQKVSECIHIPVCTLSRAKKVVPQALRRNPFSTFILTLRKG